MLKIFIGYDERQPISYHVLQQSLIAHSSKPLAITPLVLSTLPIKRCGLTPFTYSRFLVPFLCDYEGYALFIDADMVVTDDIATLFEAMDKEKAISTVRHPEKFEWASLMLFNCEKCTMLTPEFVESHNKLHDLSFLPDDQVGGLPTDWNFLVGYSKARDSDDKPPSLIHFTQGVPCFLETECSDYAGVWQRYHNQVNGAVSWLNLMGRSVHARLYDGMMVPKFYFSDNNDTIDEKYRDSLNQLRTWYQQQNLRFEVKHNGNATNG